MRVLIDSQALLHVLGTKVDFVTNRIKYAWSSVCATSLSAALHYLTRLCCTQIRVHFHKSQLQGRVRVWRVVHDIAVTSGTAGARLLSFAAQ